MVVSYNIGPGGIIWIQFNLERDWRDLAVSGHIDRETLGSNDDKGWRNLKYELPGKISECRQRQKIIPRIRNLLFTFQVSLDCSWDNYIVIYSWIWSWKVLILATVYDAIS